MDFVHKPVLLTECIDGLNITPDGIYLDATLGGGGHSSEILKRLTVCGRLIGIDKDEDAISAATAKLSNIATNFSVLHDDFKNAPSRLDELGIDKLDGVLIDLGVSSYQLDNAERGFSYMADAPLDMRMNQTQRLTAYDVVNGYSEDALAKVIWQYGEDRLSRLIAKRIVERRKNSPIKSTLELAELVARCYPPKTRRQGGNPAKRTFQAIRIEVNDELNGLYEAIEQLTLRLKVGGRICVISFHSLEDRIVKQCFAYLEAECICDKHAPICTCNKRKEIKYVSKKPITASEEELGYNSRAESAKLRISERI